MSGKQRKHDVELHMLLLRSEANASSAVTTEQVNRDKPLCRQSRSQ